MNGPAGVGIADDIELEPTRALACPPRHTLESQTCATLDGCVIRPISCSVLVERWKNLNQK